jgi:hypothetical protein
MPDGRALYRIGISHASGYMHYIYFFSTNDTKTVSINREVRTGKTGHNQTIVLDGETYQLVPQK